MPKDKQQTGSTDPILEAVYQNAPEYILVLGPDLNIVVAGRTFREVIGIGTKGAVSFLDTVERFSLSKVRGVFEELRSSDHRTIEITHRLPKGGTMTVAYSWISRTDEGGNCTGFVGIGRESVPAVAGEPVEGGDQELETLRSQLERRNAEIARLRGEMKIQATRDEMTDLGNRKFLMERLEFESARAARYEEPLTLILFDVDRMTHVNEAHGQDMGDEVLRRVAEVVKEQIRTSDIAGRYSGEEFMILCPNTERPSAQFLAERLRRRVAELSFTTEEEEFGVTISVGLVTVTGQNEFDIEAILGASEQALESAKSGGMNRVRVLEVI
jgi:diguanylate cyclase (GGDEF)-like protein